MIEVLDCGKIIIYVIIIKIEFNLFIHFNFTYHLFDKDIKMSYNTLYNNTNQNRMIITNKANTMMTQDEKKQLLERLPSLELSYESKLHKKVYSKVYYIIPKGPKALVWYTYWKDQHVCLLVKLNERGNYSDVSVFVSSFTDKLALGTIIYGTYFIYNHQHYFSCEQLHLYQGNDVAKKPYLEKLNLLLDLFENQVEQKAYVQSTLIVGMPMMTDTYESAEQQLTTLPYKTYGIGIPSGLNNKREHYKHSSHTQQQQQAQASQHQQVQPPQHQQVQQQQLPPIPAPLPNNTYMKTRSIFKVKAELDADKYILYNDDSTVQGEALIPTYKSSVMMNSLFRNIKENTNLDLLEESDDDDDFENDTIDKFVDLEKTLLMECVYSKRFKRWEPIKVI